MDSYLEHLQRGDGNRHSIQILEWGGGPHSVPATFGKKNGPNAKPAIQTSNGLFCIIKWMSEKYCTLNKDLPCKKRGILFF